MAIAASRARPALLTLRDLRFRYPDGTTVIEGLDLTVDRGEVVGLMGPNGSGKTTLLRAVARRYRRSGRDVAGGAPTVALAPDRPIFRDWLTGRENIRCLVELGGIPAGTAAERADRWLGILELGEFAERPVSTYSRGTRRRLGLAAALAGDTMIVLLDEPLSGLDPASGLRVHECLRVAAGAGRAILLTTHDPEFAETACDRVGFMAGGRLRALDEPAALLAAIGEGTLVSMRFRDTRAPLGARLGAVPAAVLEVEADDDRLVLRVRDAAAALPDLVAWAQAAGGPLASLEIRRPGLRDAFFVVTGERWERS